MTSSIHTVSPPGQQQLKQLYNRMKDTPKVPIADLTAACQSAGISKDTVTKVIKASSVSTDAEVSVAEMVLLLLTMSCESFTATVQGMFDVFGSNGQLDSQVFVQLLTFLGTRDSDISLHVRQETAQALESLPMINYQALAAIPSLSAKLAVA